MKKRINSSFMALLAFGLFSAAVVNLSRGGVLFAAADNPQAGGTQGRGRWVKAAQSPDAQPASALKAQQSITDEEAQAALAQILSASKPLSDRFDKRVIRFEVSENATRFKFDETPLFEDGAPAYGNEFVTKGYIYPPGTLTIDEEGVVSGVKADGSPEFPEKVIGRWTCRGWHVGEGAKTVTGPWVITHQLYDFGDKAGEITTDGSELVDLNVPVARAIIGGTGPFAQARGEAVQTMIGFNKLNGVALQFELKVATR